MLNKLCAIIDALTHCSQVNELGSEAAAATAVMMMLGCAMGGPPPITPKEFTADHPFTLALVMGQQALFVGRYGHNGQ